MGKVAPIAVAGTIIRTNARTMRVPLTIPGFPERLRNRGAKMVVR